MCHSWELCYTLAESSQVSYAERHGRVPNVTATRALLAVMAEMSGWAVERWVGHDDPQFTHGPRGERMGMGQAVAFLVNDERRG